MENMKHAKKLLGLLLVLAMVLSLAATAFATGGGVDAAETQLATGDVAGGGNAGGNAQTGTITIGSHVAGETYSIYLMFTLESYDAETQAYSYKITENWHNFVTDGDGKNYFVINGQGYVTMKEGVTVGDNSEDAAALAKAALKYAKDNVIAPVETLPKDGSYTASGLTMGYYLVDSSLGTLCSLDTATDSVTINEKNAVPTLLKQVEEDSTNNYGGANDADIGQTVNFKSTVTLPKGSENVVYHDTMSDGLTLDKDEGKIKVYTDDAMTAELATDNYTVTTAPTDDCDFEISFKKTYLDSLTATATVYVKYSATVNANAVVGGGGNLNTGKLSYGETGESETAPSVTKTYTWQFDILKYANGDKSKLLAGAKFVLLNQEKNKVATIVDGKLTGWVDAPATTPADANSWSANTVFITNETNNVVISGLDGGTYYLREVASPAGYNLLGSDTEVVIAPTTNDTDSTMTLSQVTAEVENKSGAQLPSTGGIGTTIFYVLGSALLIGAVVLLVARKRMNAEK